MAQIDRKTEGPLLLHLPDAAARLGLSQYSTRLLIAAGTLPHEKVGNRTYIPSSAIDEYAAKIANAS